MTNSKMEISNAKRYFKKLVSLLAAAVILSSAVMSVSAEEYADTYTDSSAEYAAEDASSEEAPAETGSVSESDRSAEDETRVLTKGSSSSSSESMEKLGRVTMLKEAKYGNDSTHPYNYQTSRITVSWLPVDNAQQYQIYIKGGKYSAWKRVKTVDASVNSYTVKNLERNTEYAFKIRAKADGYITGQCSPIKKIKTARIDFDKAGWQAMCRIVYHEVGQINDAMWDKPIVYVSDCVVNRYEAAKYLNDPLWAPYYKRYSSVQDIIYRSGGFMSDSGLARDGATYSRCTSKVKLAVYGAVYDKKTVSGISNDDDIFYWSNTSYKPGSYKVAYSYKIPWGYFNIWSEYWG